MVSRRSSHRSANTYNSKQRKNKEQSETTRSRTPVLRRGGQVKISDDATARIFSHQRSLLSVIVPSPSPLSPSYFVSSPAHDNSLPGVCECTGQGGMPLTIFVIGIVRVMAPWYPVL